MQLWHVSDRGDISRFEPRLPANARAVVPEPVVWAVADSHLENYLLPRDCPRICLRAASHTTDVDRTHFFGASQAPVIIIIEAAWLDRATHTPLWRYALPPTSFTCADLTAGYFVSRRAVNPDSVEKLESPLTALLARDVELRVVSRLRPLAERVAASTLAFSVIRLRHAAP